MLPIYSFQYVTYLYTPIENFSNFYNFCLPMFHIDPIPHLKILKKYLKTESNMPKGHATPEELKVFISSIKSELSDHKYRNKENCNLPVKDINIQDRHIVIKPFDKGAGFMILKPALTIFCIKQEMVNHNLQN